MPDRPVVIMMTSNGVGMGHLSRQLTTALSGPHRFDPVVFSLSKALPRVMNAAGSGELPEAEGRNLRFEYAPSWESGWRPKGWRGTVRAKYRSWRWAPYLRDRVCALAAEVGASALVFDGVAPYPGLLQARENLPGMKFVWVRRGLWQAGAPAERLDRSKFFDLTIEPGDIARDFDRGPTRSRSDATRVDGPVSLTNVLTPLPRAQAREALGLPADRPLLLLAPGSGALGSVDETAGEVLEALASKHPDWAIAITRQSIAKHSVRGDGKNVFTLSNVYPLARYLAAFDAGVGAAGYNAVHEMLGAKIPTLLIPSQNHLTDDQPLRAEGAAKRGVALQVKTTIAAVIDELCDAGRQQELVAHMEGLEEADGGLAIADAVASLLPAARPTGAWHPGKVPAPVPDLRVRGGRDFDGDIAFTSSPTVDLLLGECPIEHVLAGASAGYRDAREEIARWLYRPA